MKRKSVGSLGLRVDELYITTPGSIAKDVLFVLVLVNSYFWVALFYAAVSTGPLAVVYLYILYCTSYKYKYIHTYVYSSHTMPSYFNTYVHTYVSHRQ